jgi:two-component system response regulator
MLRIVVVEDNDQDYEAIERILNRTLAISLIRCWDGEDLLNYLMNPSTRSARWPSLILLDLNMPGTDGREALTRLKTDRELHPIPTIIFSTSSSPKDLTYCYAHGANGYMVKPVNYLKLEHQLRGLVEYWTNVMQLPPPPQKVAVYEGGRTS